MIPIEVAQKYLVIPINRSGPTLRLAMVDPGDVHAIDDIKFMTNYEVIPLISTEGAILDAIANNYDTGGQDLATVLRGIEENGDDVEAVVEEEEAYPPWDPGRSRDGFAGSRAARSSHPNYHLGQPRRLWRKKKKWPAPQMPKMLLWSSWRMSS